GRSEVAARQTRGRLLAYTTVQQGGIKGFAYNSGGADVSDWPAGAFRRRAAITPAVPPPTSTTAATAATAIRALFPPSPSSSLSPAEPPVGVPVPGVPLAGEPGVSFAPGVPGVGVPAAAS